MIKVVIVDTHIWLDFQRPVVPGVCGASFILSGGLRVYLGCFRAVYGVLRACRAMHEAGPEQHGVRRLWMAKLITDD